MGGGWDLVKAIVIVTASAVKPSDLTLPYLTLPYLTLPYLYLTLPYLTLNYLKQHLIIIYYLRSIHLLLPIECYNTRNTHLPCKGGTYPEARLSSGAPMGP